MRSYDINVLAVCFDKIHWARFKPYVKDYALSKECADIFKVLGDYYENYPTHDKVDVNTLRTFYFLVKGKSVKEDKAIILHKLFDNIEEEAKAPSAAIDDVLKNMVLKDFSTRIFNKAMGVATTGKPGDNLDEIETLVHDYNKEVGRAVTSEDLFVAPSLAVVAKAVGAPGYEWRLEELNRSAGPIRTGDFILVAARPEVGKTTFAASEVSWMQQWFPPGRPCIWVNNEEASDKVMFRVMQSYFGVTSVALLANIATYEARYKAEVGDRIKVMRDDSGMNHVSRLEALFKEENPALIVFDQLDKVDGFSGEDREDLRIGKVWGWGRKMAKTFCPVIALSQVDGTGEGEKWLTQNQLRGSKTDKPGEPDAIITIGKSNDPTEEYNRYIHLPKNKLHGGPRSEEVHRHGYFEVEIVPAIARYKGMYK